MSALSITSSVKPKIRWNAARINRLPPAHFPPAVGQFSLGTWETEMSVSRISRRCTHIVCLHFHILRRYTFFPLNAFRKFYFTVYVGWQRDFAPAGRRETYPRVRRQIFGRSNSSVIWYRRFRIASLALRGLKFPAAFSLRKPLAQLFPSSSFLHRRFISRATRALVKARVQERVSVTWRIAPRDSYSATLRGKKINR